LAILPCLALAFVATSARADQTEETAAKREISFQRDVEPIFSRHCYGCHQGAKQLGSYLMTDFTALLSGGESEQVAIVPGNPRESYLLEQITPVDGHAEMPDEPFEPLSESEVATVRDWILQGAKNDSIAQGARYTAENLPKYVGAPPLPSIDISPDGTKVAVAGFYEVVVLDATSGKKVARLVGMSPRLNTVRFSPDGKRLAAVGGTPAVRGEIQIWKLDSSELALSRSVSYDTLSGASWSPDGSKLAFGATDNVVRAIDTESGEQILYQGAHEDWVRDTAFTPDGKHVISVARDMSCKLTEVETERFIDNITSITPGALSGGLSSVRPHPTRNEILVGGADGVAKVYRVFRETARKIGDDANLVRKLPKLPGRIFSVAISPDASRLAAAATLDGKSEIRVWNYDFTSELTPELKAILAKRVAERNAEENKKVDAYQNSEIKELAKLSIDTAATYAIDFAPDNSLVIAASDGKIRRLDPDGKVASVHPAVELSDDESIAATGFDARAWNEAANQESVSNATAEIMDAVQISSLSVEPSELTFDSPYAYAQLIVTARLADGSMIDVTRLCQVDLPDWATMEPTGLVRPASNGDGAIQITLGDQSATIKASATGVSVPEDAASEHGAVDYIQDVGPILSRLGCNQGTCHGAQKGKNGFRLSLRGYDPTFDLRALTDDLAARRINPSSPDESLMLRKPLGLSPHQGGVVMSSGDPNHTILRRWIKDGSHVEMSSPRVTRIEVFPVNPIVQRTDAQQQVRVVAHYENGKQRDVTREAFIESGNTEVATANRTGLLSAVRRGEAPILARYEGSYAATTLTVMGDRQDYKSVETETWSRVDELVAQKWERVKVAPSELCDDATFLRRLYLDLTGLPPASEHVRSFLDDPTPTRVKRAKIVDELIGSDAYIDFWTNKWADLLQVNRKFLGVEGSTKFRDWIRTAVAENRPYDEFARQILTASGSNNENPPASYFKVLRTPEDTMENTTHLFLGIRFNCNKCHDHPFERWTQDQYYQMSAFFAQVGLENDPASGNRKVAGTAVEGAKPLFEKVVDKKKGDINHPRTSEVVPPEFPFAVPHDAITDGSRREQLAAWITDPDNPYFARSYVNRLWGYLFGVGLIEPIDDIRAGNPATNPELLSHLTKAFVDSNFDVAQMHRMICNSRTYQLSVKTNPLNEDDSLNYSHAIPRRLPAEVIYDAVHSLTGAVSSIPGMPAGTRAAALTDSGVKLADGFLQNLGRPARESACECERNSDLQLGPVMALISGPTIGTAIADPKNELERIVAEHPDDNALAEEIFLRALARRPTESELAAFTEMKAIIQDSHRDLVTELETAEQEWKGRRVGLEKQREERLAAIIKTIEARTEEIRPERERLAKEREDRIKAAEAVITKAEEKVEAKIDKWSSDQENGVEWFPLAATNASSTNKAVLTPLSDRSILASGNKAKTVYTITAKTKLNNITGLRLEALTDDGLPTKGPGSAPNGNFVLTELEVTAAPAASPKDANAVKIASGVADFLQDGFAIAQTFDGRTRDQGGWAVSGATGKEHWATFKFEKPISVEGGVVLTFKMHQFHNAAEHTLGRFRFSVTTRDGEIPLDTSETFAAALSTPKANRSDALKDLLRDHIASTDAEIRKANAGLAAAKAGVPPDATLVKLEKRKEALSKPTPDDPALVQLREDAKQSNLQLQKIRLTAAEDLTWALINSPAFLFNH
jgi:WD40 repeat protein